MAIHNLENALIECRNLLKRAGEKFWSERIDQLVANRTGGLSAADAAEILSWYGGMGSFNDLILSPLNGHSVTDRESRTLNQELDKLRATIHQEAATLSR